MEELGSFGRLPVFVLVGSGRGVPTNLYPDEPDSSANLGFRVPRPGLDSRFGKYVKAIMAVVQFSLCFKTSQIPDFRQELPRGSAIGRSGSTFPHGGPSRRVFQAFPAMDAAIPLSPSAGRGGLNQINPSVSAAALKCVKFCRGVTMHIVDPVYLERASFHAA
jgi:hypothetical protein